MKSIEIKATLRNELGKKQTKALRRQGLVPCVMYGGEENIHFTAQANELRHLLYTHDVFLVKLDINGKAYQAFLKDSQFHPVSDEVLHLDFIQIFDDKPAVVELPITVSGNSEGIRAGGKLRQRRRYLKVKGLLKDLPEYLDVDITKLKIGDFIKVNNLDYKNLELLDPAMAMVVGVSASRLSKGGPAGDELGEGEGEEAAATASEGGEAPAEG
ncbi:MAG: 50S ribosomal protein L25/general stress protein Ctc [Bacteroidales bacterium]|nr:50S ribosomal protein L25/general stress protein Ctc [Bacteroidales bacterium]